MEEDIGEDDDDSDDPKWELREEGDLAVGDVGLGMWVLGEDGEGGGENEKDLSSNPGRWYGRRTRKY